MIKTRFKNPYTFNKLGQRFTTFPERKKSGVYLIKEDNTIVYIGYSTKDLYKTMYRHFQTWNHREQEVVTYAGQDLDRYSVRVIYCTPKQAEAAEKYLIKKYKPRDNSYKYENIILNSYDKTTGKKIQETQTAPDYVWKPDPKDMMIDYSDFTPEYAEPFDLFGLSPQQSNESKLLAMKSYQQGKARIAPGTNKSIESILDNLTIEIIKILPKGYHIENFTDGGGTFGISYYATIYYHLPIPINRFYDLNPTGHTIKVRISDHGSNQCLGDTICSNWTNTNEITTKLKSKLIGEPAKKGKTEKALLKWNNETKDDFIQWLHYDKYEKNTA